MFEYECQRTSGMTSVKEESIIQYMDKNCDESCIVFVNGQYSSNLSKRKSIPESILASSIFDLSDSELRNILPSINMVPDLDELPRNKYGSDVLALTNQVQCARHL